ncbi:hypothetical protein CIFRMM109B1_18215 [Citrobacter freundii]|jgi:hypothetical protein|nr:MAG TPA: hypothetical protein [Caudoviricetes sp.]
MAKPDWEAIKPTADSMAKRLVQIGNVIGSFKVGDAKF